MEPWNVLGILPTRDKTAIKNAYKEQLAHTHPEEKPEEFKALRAAYEQALKEAEESQKQQPAPADESPLGRWAAQMEQVYADFARRIDPEEWRRLCGQEAAFSLASRSAARDRLLEYFTSNYYLPHTVWQVLEEHFAFLQDLEELAERFPPAFLDRVVKAGIEFDDYVRYEWFSECHTTAPDDYLRLYFKVEGLIRSGEEGEARAALEQLRGMPVSHPFTDLLQTRFYIRCRQYPEAVALAEQNLAPHPENMYLAVAAADANRFAGNFERAAALYEALLKDAPDYNPALYGFALCCQQLARWKEATDTLEKLLAKFPTDHELHEALQKMYGGWAEQLRGALEQDPADRRAQMDYAWCCLELGESKKGLELLEGFAPQTLAERYEYESTCGNLCLSLDDHEGALRHAIAWEQAIRDIPEDTEDEDLKKKKGRLSRSFEMQAAALNGFGKLDQALEKLEQAKALDPGQERIWRNQCQWLWRAKRYQEVRGPAQKLMELLPGDPVGFYYMGLAQFEALDYRQAYDSFCEALERDSRSLDFYLYKIRILLIYKKWEEAKKELDFLAENGVKCDALTFLQARYDQLAGDEQAQKAAYDVFQELLNKPDLDLYFKDQLYFAASFDERLRREKQLELLEAGLKWRPQDYDLQCRTVWLYNEMGRFMAAIRLAKSSLEQYPFSTGQKYRLAHAYGELGKHAGAAALYRENAEQENDAEDWYLAGRNYYYAGQPAAAKECLDKALEMQPDNAYALRILSLIARDAGDEQAALAAARAAVDKEQEKSKVHWHWRHLGNLLNHFRRSEQAADAWLHKARLTGELDDYKNADRSRLKAADWSRALQARMEYFQKHPLDKDQWDIEQAWVLLLRGDLAGAKRFLFKLFGKNQAKDYPYIVSCYWLAMGDNARAYESWKKIDPEQRSDRETSVFLMMLRDLGRTQELEQLARQRIGRIKRLPAGGQQLLCLSAQAVHCVFQGRPDLARKRLAQAQDKPLCEHCDCPYCRDMALARAYLAEYEGDLALALSIFEQQYKTAPDDEEVVLGVLRLKRKMNK